MDGAEDLLASDIVEQISTIKKKVDALQIAAAREKGHGTKAFGQ